MKTPLLILAAVFLVGCETSTVEQPTPVQVVESVYGKPIVARFEAKCVGVSDGDTIKILNADNEQIRVRLESIDCPESKQAFGAKAKQAMSALVFGKVVTILKTGEDRYKRYSADQSLAGLEAEAKATKRGLWADAEPVEPWDWRAKEKN